MNEKKAMKAYKALRGMESAADLKRAGFTLAEYHAACDCLQEYARNNGETERQRSPKPLQSGTRNKALTYSRKASAGASAEQKL